jgi:hypothetical protein
VRHRSLVRVQLRSAGDGSLAFSGRGAGCEHSGGVHHEHSNYGWDCLRRPRFDHRGSCIGPSSAHRRTGTRDSLERTKGRFVGNARRTRGCAHPSGGGVLYARLFAAAAHEDQGWIEMSAFLEALARFKFGAFNLLDKNNDSESILKKRLRTDLWIVQKVLPDVEEQIRGWFTTINLREWATHVHEMHSAYARLENGRWWLARKLFRPNPKAVVREWRRGVKLRIVSSGSAPADQRFRIDPVLVVQQIDEGEAAEGGSARSSVSTAVAPRRNGSITPERCPSGQV